MHSIQAPPGFAVLYRIDGSDTIVEVGGDWDEFARANGGVGDVVGRPLWQFVSGDDVSAVWRLMLRRVRSATGPLAFLYRCDAPGVRRLLQMELLGEDDGFVAFRSTLVSTAVEPTYTGTWTKSSGTVAVCGWCARVRLEDRWVQPEEVSYALGLTGDRDTQLSHGVCETCARELVTAR
jgi:hypothetical protein